MASRTTVILIDDLDGTELGESGETVTFSLDGVSYEIDLSSSNAAQLRSSVAKFIRHGRRVGGRRIPGSGGKTRIDPEQLRAARTWLRKNGHDVSDRGRIKASLMDLYLNNAGT